MEGKITRFPKEEIQKINNLTEDFLLTEDSKYDEKEAEMSKKSTKELAQEEEKLKLHLCHLKKENFTLQTNINAWQKTLKNKLDEFKEADLKLDKIYTEIWAEREKFCSEADKFNHSYGIFSDWWKMQMDFLSDLENLGNKRSDDRKCREEIDKLEKEIKEIKKEIETLQNGKEIVEAEVHSTEDGNSPTVRGENMTQEISPRKLCGKRKTDEINDQIIDYEEAETARNDLFSMVDVEKVRTANRNRNRRKALLGKVKTFFTR